MIQPLFIRMLMKMRWTIYLKALAVKLIGSSLVKQQIVKISRDYIMLNLEYLRSLSTDFIP